MSECDKIVKNMESAFDLIMMDNLSEDPAEMGISPYEYAMDYLYVDDVISEVVNMVDTRRCFSRSQAMDILEGYWQKKIHQGKYEWLSKEVTRI